MHRLSFLITLFLLCIGSALLYSLQQPLKTDLQARAGIIDVSEEIKENTPIDLQGEWLFFYNQFLSPEEIESQSLQASSITAPHAWDLTQFNAQADHAQGYGTYHLKIIIGKVEQPIAIYVPVINSAYRLYLNDELRITAGEPGRSRSTTKPHFAPQPLIIKQPSSVINLTIQVANYGYQWGGMLYPLKIGQSKVLLQNLKNTAMTKVFLGGFLLAIAIYNLVLFSMRSSNKIPLVFALLCFILGLREFFVEEFVVLNYFPDLSVTQIITTDHLTFFLAVPILMHFNYLIFEKYFKKSFVMISYVISVLSSLTLLIFGLDISDLTLTIMQMFVPLIIAYILFIIIKALKARQKGVLVILLGNLVMAVCVMNDILYALEMIQSIYLTSLGVAIYVLSQSYMTAISLNEGFVRSKELGKQLQEHNFKLEQLTLQQEEKITARTYELAEANAYLQKLAHTDPLTQISNRNGSRSVIKQLEARFKRNNNPYSVALLDLDYFKRVNDKYGHDVGDKVLKNVAAIIKNNIRSQDVLVRWGGEEFVILLPETQLQGAMIVADKIRKTIEQSAIEMENEQLFVSATIGIAEINQNELFATVLKRADIALFKGKKQGRNQVVM